MLRRFRQWVRQWLDVPTVGRESEDFARSETMAVVGALVQQCPSLIYYPELIRFMVGGIGGINGIYEFTHVATGRWVWTGGRWVHESRQKPGLKVVK